MKNQMRDSLSALTVDAVALWCGSGADIESLDVKIRPARGARIANRRVELAVGKWILPALAKIVDKMLPAIAMPLGLARRTARQIEKVSLSYASQDVPETVAVLGCEPAPRISWPSERRAHSSAQWVESL